MGRQLLCYPPPRSSLDGAGFRRSDWLFWCPLEHEEDKTSSHGSEVHWDLNARTVALPAEKQSKMLQLLGGWLNPSKTVLAQEAASLYGKLIHMSCIYPLI